MIRKAGIEDISRIAEILVFVKRMNYRRIVQDDSYSFGELQVLPVAEQYSDRRILESIHVFEEEGIVKGIVRIEDDEVSTLYVDHFFQNQGIGSELIEYAKGLRTRLHLWALEKNTGAIHFYESHGFRLTDEKMLEVGTPEYLVKMEWNQDWKL
ncbi:MAG: GNAT family N-acetyltransferase [Atopobiaceae bacterium]|nr:GNAT family N-acetyltransferase [Atopobiaceae bacterium]